MDNSMIKGIVIGGAAAVAVAASGVTGYQALNQPTHAEVVAVKEVKETVSAPRKECHEVAVRRRAPVQDENRIAGTAIGAVAGGLLGSTIGRGNGRTVATLAGAAAGGYAGNKVQQGMQDKDTVAATETRCKMVYENTEKRLGYDVTYRLNGKQEVVRMDYDPGGQIPLHNGRLVLNVPPEKN